MQNNDDIFEDRRRADLHEWFVSEAKGKEADVLFIGDDHIALFEQSFVYREHFAPLHCLCFGALGDRISDLRWRLENKVLEGLNPKMLCSAGYRCFDG
uniref:Platelet-activating factor acetylhydrolase IB subunit beta n=1 Tax=Ascaris suum TaxID=6253 RepID=F1LD18_ASCSU